MSDINKQLQPLQDVLNVLDEREQEVEQMTNLTAEELESEKKEIAQDVAKQLIAAIPTVKDNIEEYIKLYDGIPEDDKIGESTLTELIDNIVNEIGGVDYPSRDTLMKQLGLVATETDDAFNDLDKNSFLSKEEVRQETYDETVTGIENLNINIKSVVRAYIDEISLQNPPVTSLEGLKNFLITTKVPLVLNALSQKYSKKEESSVGNQQLLVKKSGNIADTVMATVSGTPEVFDPELGKFYEALSIPGFSIEEKAYLGKNGEYNAVAARIVIEKQIEAIFSKENVGATTIESYKKSVLDNTLATPEGLTKKGLYLARDLMEQVPDNFLNTKYETDYKAHVEELAKKGKKAEGFMEYLESPTNSKTKGMMNQLNIGLLNHGINISELFDTDGFFGKILKALGIISVSDEDLEDDEAFKNNKEYKSRHAYDYNEKAKKLITKVDIEALNWEDVQISGIEMKEDGKPNLSSFTPDKLVILKEVLESDNCTFAKTKDLTLDELVWIKDNVTTRAEDSFTVTNGDDINTFSYTPEGIIAAKECIKEISIEGQIGLEYVDYFSEGFALPDKAFTDTENKEFATLQPALKSLLKLDKSKFWKEYNLDVDTFLRNMDEGITSQGAFDNSENTFEESGDSFDVKGSGWFTDTSYSSVGDFMKSLK